MPRNVEIKARARCFVEQLGIAQEIAGGPPEELRQTDTFFHCAAGRLKLREFDDGTGELIHYHRPDRTRAKMSSYTIFRVDQPQTLKKILAESQGTRGVVRKRRLVYLLDNTRVHFDEVEQLGQFIELEVVLGSEQTEQDGQEVAERLCERLLIRPEDLVDRAYVDMLEA